MRRALLAAIVALYLVLPLSAARDFTVNTSNYIKRGNDSFGERLHAQAGTSVHAWVYLDTLPTGGAQWTIVRGPLGTNADGPFGLHFLDTAGTTNLRVQGRSAAADSLQARASSVAFSTGAWYSVGGVLNYATDVVTPYVDGAASNGGSVAFISGTYQHTAVSDNDFSDSIGTQISNTGAAISGTQMDGRIAEVAVWTGDIGAAGYAQLARGISPLQVVRQNLIFYLPMLDTNTRSLVSYVGFPGTQETWPYTVTGSLPIAAHPPTLIRHPGGH